MFVICVLLVILFIFWQFKMLKKYALAYDSFKLNIPGRYVVVKGGIIPFEEIDFVTVRELEQPSMLEKTFSKSACYAYMAEVVFHLKSGCEVTCTFNNKGVLYKTLKQVAPFVQVNGDIDCFKPQMRWGVLLVIVAVIILVCLLRN